MGRNHNSDGKVVYVTTTGRMNDEQFKMGLRG